MYCFEQVLTMITVSGMFDIFGRLLFSALSVVGKILRIPIFRVTFSNGTVPLHPEISSYP
jgi:hypothetical protein